MSGVRKDFCLDEVVAGTLRVLCETYSLDGSWLAWQYERHVLINGASPFRVDTGSYAHSFKEGIDELNVEIEFDHTNPNSIKWIRFDESPSKKFVITQTSIKHLREGGTCALWLELPQGAGSGGDISAVQRLLKVEPCCAEWRDYLTPNPETPLERAQLVIAQDDIDWMRKQVALKDKVASRLTGALAFKGVQTDALQKEVNKLNGEIAKVDALKDKIEELKSEIKAETRAKDKAIDELKAELKAANKSVETLKTTVKTKADTIATLRADLKGKEKSDTSGSDSHTLAESKKRKRQAPRTPKTPKSNTRRMPNVLETPKTAPAQFGSPSSNLFPNLPYTTAAFSVGRAEASPSVSRHRYNTRGGGVSPEVARAMLAPSPSDDELNVEVTAPGDNGRAANLRSGGLGSPVYISSGGEGGAEGDGDGEFSYQ